MAELPARAQLQLGMTGHMPGQSVLRDSSYQLGHAAEHMPRLQLARYPSQIMSSCRCTVPWHDGGRHATVGLTFPHRPFCSWLICFHWQRLTFPALLPSHSCSVLTSALHLRPLPLDTCTAVQ